MQLLYNNLLFQSMLCSTSFGLFRPSSGAHKNCKHSIGYSRAFLLPAASDSSKSCILLVKILEYISMMQGNMKVKKNVVMNFGFHKMRGLSWLFEDLLVSQEGLCSLELLTCSAGWRKVLFVGASNRTPTFQPAGSHCYDAVFRFHTWIINNRSNHSYVQFFGNILIYLSPHKVFEFLPPFALSFIATPNNSMGLQDGLLWNCHGNRGRQLL
jgi:hypothetical protein